MSHHTDNTEHAAKAALARRRTRRQRMAVALFVVALMCFSLAFHSGVGSPSAFGLGSFSLLCPLGGLEALLASKVPIPHALISLAVVVVVCLVVGRAWCAWACPAHVVRGIFARKEPKAERAVCKRSLWETFKSDSRLWVLAGVLLATLVVGLPVFCLICPIGLTFGTIMSVWRLIQFNDVNAGLLVFPAALVIELIMCKKWCITVCPIAGLLALFGRWAKPLRPHIEEASCLQHEGKECGLCHTACPVAIDLHAEDAAAQLADCMRCKECQSACPTQSITFPLLDRQNKEEASRSERPQEP